MAKHYQTFEHTADIGLTARADTLGELFEALAECLAGLIVPPRQVAATGARRIEVRAEDVEALAVDFLAAVMNTIQTDHFMVAAVRVSEISETAVVAKLRGESYAPARHELGMEVKAVTYHQLSIARDGGTWAGRVILDI